jgi:2-polyprenyl-6-methoxyphenol hydroxylase-like FAD-dependent oxidoreductase
MNVDVVICGAGPVGLMLGCELRLAGVNVLVVERRREPDLTIKAGSISPSTAVLLARRGLLPELTERQRRAFERMAAFSGHRGDSAAPPRPRMVGHFAGIMVGLEAVDLTDPAFRDAGPAAQVIMVSQQDVEEMLAATIGAIFDTAVDAVLSGADVALVRQDQRAVVDRAFDLLERGLDDVAE